ncbi:MAG: saccharopine dehydrogenase C-terminal domain-containing protein [Alphaproteobacteria bacterium]
MTDWPNHGRIDGPIVMIGFGTIGRGTLPLLLRHFDLDRSRFTVIDPDDSHRGLVDEAGVTFLKSPITRENYKELLTPLLTKGQGQPFIVNLSVDVSSVDMILFAQQLGALYVDTVVEPWKGHYTDPNLTMAQRTNYALRETARALVGAGKTTAVSCCGANPGMVSWFVKQALVNLAKDLGRPVEASADRDGWARLMHDLGVKGVHIAERDTQRVATPKPMRVFRNTWSVEGFVSEGVQPAELGWGTHEKRMPADAQGFETGCKAAIFLPRPGAATRVRTWTPVSKAQHGFLVTHNESISIADYFTLRDGDEVVFRPTCHYAYHPCDDAVLSLHELFGNEGRPQPEFHTLDEDELVDGVDELGVLLYGHEKNAYWFGSSLSIEQTRALAPYQNATGLQVTSAVLAGMVWALENPTAGVVETDEIDFARCLEVQLPYLGDVFGAYTDWHPLKDRLGLFPEQTDESDPWQFTNVLVG